MKSRQEHNLEICEKLKEFFADDKHKNIRFFQALALMDAIKYDTHVLDPFNTESSTTNQTITKYMDNSVTRQSKLAATALIYKDTIYNGKVLGVSRKTDITDFGLPGGKVEGNETLYEAMVREVYEETGLTVLKAEPLFFREDREFVAVVFVVTEYLGEINTEESGKVEWIEFEELKKGSFGKYNTALEEHINFINNAN
jgi:8-oxo-dGTP diphosphatase